MTIQEMLRENNMSVYKLSKASAVPYATCNDIVSGKADLKKCSAETLYKIAQVLNVSMESILSPCFIKRSSFENFKSSICHRVKELGDIDFIIDTLESQDIRRYFEREWYPESLYLLAIISAEKMTFPFAMNMTIFAGAGWKIPYTRQASSPCRRLQKKKMN